MIHKHVFMTVYPSHAAAVYIHFFSLSISQGIENLNIMYVNIKHCAHRAELKEERKNQQRCCVQSTNVENLRGYQVSFFVIFTHYRQGYSRSIYYSTKDIRWHSIAEFRISLMEINIKIFFILTYMTVFIKFLLYIYLNFVSAQLILAQRLPMIH